MCSPQKINSKEIVIPAIYIMVINCARGKEEKMRIDRQEEENIFGILSFTLNITRRRKQ